MKELKFAILGFGGIAGSHFDGYKILKEEGFPVKLVAICDINENQFYAEQEINIGAAPKADLAGLNLYTSFDEMLDKEDFDVVDICLPTYLHKEYAIKAMKAGKHVQSEKPMSLNSADCQEMLAVAKKYDRKLTIGQCLHFEAGYMYLKKCIEEGTFGKLYTIDFNRLSSLPRWGFEFWYQDRARSGGCPFDLHVHDIDMANYCLGMPKTVSALTIDGEKPVQYITSRLVYDNGAIVTATGSFIETSGFVMNYRARFENATLVYDGSSVLVRPKGAPAYEAEGTKDGQRKDRMAEEIKFIANLVMDPDFDNSVNNPEGAANSIYLIEKLIESAEKNGEILTV